MACTAPGYDKNIIKYYGMGPHLHDYLQEMNHEVVSKYNIMTVAEVSGSTLKMLTICLMLKEMN